MQSIINGIGTYRNTEKATSLGIVTSCAFCYNIIAIMINPSAWISAIITAASVLSLVESAENKKN